MVAMGVFMHLNLTVVMISIANISHIRLLTMNLVDTPFRYISQAVSVSILLFNPPLQYAAGHDLLRSLACC